MSLYQLIVEFIELPWMYNCWRVGLNGDEFWCYKLRTMIINADKNKPAHTLTYKENNDSRILKSKGWMRRIGLDEVPQLYNIVKGEMHFFGARPLVKDDWNQLTKIQQKRRASRKPGCFGPYAMLRDKKNKNNLLKANDAYLRILYKKNRLGKKAVIYFNTKVFMLTILAILQGKVK